MSVLLRLTPLRTELTKVKRGRLSFQSVEMEAHNVGLPGLGFEKKKEKSEWGKKKNMKKVQNSRNVITMMIVFLFFQRKNVIHLGVVDRTG